MARRYRQLGVLALLFVLHATHTWAQSTPISIGNEAVNKFLEVLAQDDSPDAANALGAIRSEEPRFIFVPGVLGSKLTVNNGDGTEPFDIWGGELFNTPSLQITGDRIETAPLDEMDAIVAQVEVYGQALSDLASRSINSELLSVYSYDWRMDNRVSAARLQQWMCDNRARFEGHKIYFLTHSMGSLVVKFWFAKFRNVDCETKVISDNSSWMDIEEVIMLGAPLYGAPSAISAFANGTQLTEGNFFGAAIRPFDQASRQLNEHGATFPSAYQLLPIYKEDCFAGHDAAASPLFLRANDQSTSEVEGLFSVGTWKSLGWPARLPDYLTREDYYANFLPEVLESARHFQCELAAFDLGAEVETTYFYGVLPGLSTLNALEVKRDGETTMVQQSCTAAANNCLEKGDGTVPAIIAKNAFGTGRDSSRSTNNAHKDLLRSDEVAEYVATILSRNSVKAFVAAAGESATGFQALMKVAAEAGTILPVFDGLAEESDAIQRINLATLTTLNVDTDRISLLAQQTSDPESILQWNSVLKTLPYPDQQIIFSNFNRAGIIAHSTGDYDGALKMWDAAIAAAGTLPKEDVRAELGDLYVLRGDSWTQTLNPEAAYSDYTAAIGLGNNAGKAGIQSLQSDGIVFNAPMFENPTFSPPASDGAMPKFEGTILLAP